MIKLTKEQTRIFEFVILGLAIFALIMTVIGLTKAIKNKKVVETSSIEESPMDYNDLEGEEIEIIDENNIEEQATENESKNVNAKEKQTNNKSKTNSSQYYIKINYGQNVVTIYKKDSAGEYTVPVKAMVCSTGTATPRSGVYSLKSRWKWGGLFGNVYGYYCIQIVGNILFHSVPYLKRGDPSSLEYWEYDKLGTSASAGCIRLTLADVRWIYNNVPSGTLVEFYSSSNLGPLRKA